MRVTTPPKAIITWIWITVLIIASFVLAPLPGLAGTDMGGWERDGAYDRNYNNNELEKFRATVVKVIELAPMKGMAKGVALLVKESEDDPEAITVHICPTWYMSKKEIGIKRGDRLKIRGSWAEIDGEDVFMAAKIKRGEYFQLKVRLTKDGKPFWTMDPEELAREKSVQ